MEVNIEYFEKNPIRMISKDGTTNMVNIVDVGKIMNINVFEWLETEPIKSFISVLEKGYELYYGSEPSEELMFIESSTEVYVHTMIFCKLTFRNHMPLYKWFYSHEYLEA